MILVILALIFILFILLLNHKEKFAINPKYFLAKSIGIKDLRYLRDCDKNDMLCILNIDKSFVELKKKTERIPFRKHVDYQKTQNPKDLMPIQKY